MRFRRQLVERGLDRNLFEAISRDLESKGACVRKGTLVDATVIGSASKGDREAAWVRHRTRAPAYGYKAHIAADKDSGILRAVETAPANEADVSIAPAIVPDEPGEVYADRAYDALAVEKAIEAAGGTSKLLRKGRRHLPRRREVRRGDLERAKFCNSIKLWPCNLLEPSFQRGVTPSSPSMAIRSAGARCASLARNFALFVLKV